MSQQVPTTPQAVPISSTEVDLLIIGSGTGLATALAAHELGLNVAVAEKTLQVGGSTARSGGAIWLPGNPVLAADGSSDTIESAEEYLEATVGDSSPRERWQTVLDHGPETVRMLGRTTTLKFNWVEGYSDYFPELPGGSPQGRSIESEPYDLAEMGESRARFQPAVTPTPFPMPVTSGDYKWVTMSGTLPERAGAIMEQRITQGKEGQLAGREYAAGGQALAGGLYAGVIRAEIPVWTGAELVELVREGDRVVGARLRQGDEETTVLAAHGVVLATGGFDHNMEMRREHQSPSMMQDLSFGAAGNIGDGIRIAQRIGADIASMDQAWWFPAVAPAGEGAPALVMLAERALPGSIIVDRGGKRFINEAVGYMRFGQEVLRRERAGDPVGSMWMVFDKQYRDSYMFAGMVPPTEEIPEYWYEADVAHRASSVEELAAAIGVPSAALAQTLTRFNTDAAAGSDREFGRGESAYDRYYGDPTQSPNMNLRPIDSGQLYAVLLVMSDLGTCGGVRADGSGRVLDTDGHVIPGLFAQGNTAANAFGTVYPGAGATIGQGVVYGMVIAQAAAREREEHAVSGQARAAR